MTNKEAVEILNPMFEQCKGTNYFSKNEELALDLAIQALEERPQGDLISRSALKEATQKLYEETPDGIVKFGIEKTYDLIDNAPTVEPERPQGRWLHNSDRPDTLICSVCNCGWDMWHYESKELKYCPNCGADMRGGKE